MRNATLLFLVKSSENKVTDICLAMKKRGFGVGRYNGAGGKVNVDEAVEDAMVREAKEEISVVPIEFSKVAELEFTFPENPSFDQMVHVYFATEWMGDPTESEEMAPRWFGIKDIPFAQMWPDDIYWLPSVIAGKRIKKAQFTFGPLDSIKSESIEFYP